MFVIADMQRAGKQHVLEKMCEAGAAGALVLRSDVIPEIDGHQRRGVILVEDDLKAIVQRVRFESEHAAPFTTNDERSTMSDERRFSSFILHRSSFILPAAWTNFPGDISRSRARSESGRRRWSPFSRSASKERRSSKTSTIHSSTTSTRTNAARHSVVNCSFCFRDTTSSAGSRRAI